MKFEDLNLEEDLQEGIDAIGFSNATPIQELAIPIILDNNDLIACAQTGTGKTAAYLLPILNKLVTEHGDYINTVIIAPTRELAKQVDQQLEGLAYFTNTSSIAIYGGGDGASWSREKKALNEGADVIIATPGKLISHLRQGFGDFTKLKHLILDEADRMLEMGFYEDIMEIISYFPKERQTLLFSATMPERIRKLANNILKEPKQVNIAISKPAEGVVQAAFLTYDDQKVELIKWLLQDDDVPSAVIFSSTKANVKKICSTLKKIGLKAEEIHSDLEQSEREEVLRGFKNQNYSILVATDIISRGIDIDSISLVINYDVPQDAEDYIHRIGRTARAESTGEGITFINEKDQFNFKKIEDLIGNEIRKVPLPKHLGEGPEYNPGRKGGKKKFGKGKFFKKKKKPYRNDNRNK
ncbi:DEAD/DEAH box helicase [Flexithrix dorotheae]|uniref:DEAD/DEAH box helicase n=1 Tax=Flexithrix dorotheae TaxID=70993 RepID=UPI00036F9F89|nr:DEAD/DEAH box helicase [Flexithrix dorotheae]